MLSVTIGLNALRANPVRALLSTLGVVMGVASLVAVLALGDGVEAFAREQLERTTSIQAIEVRSRTTRELDGIQLPVTDYPVFTPADAQALVAAMSAAREVRHQVVGAGRVRLAGSDSLRGVSVFGLTGWPSLKPPPLAAGRFLEPADSTVVVVSHDLALAVAAGGGAATALGKTVRIEDAAWTIVGVIEAQRGAVAFTAVVPAAAASQAMVPALTPRLPTLVVTARRVEDVEVAKAEVEGWLAGRDSGWRDRVTVTTQLARAKQARQGMLIFKLLMGAITGISLLVGGIGIMNVLLASVAERTREIGIRKAAGARRRDVLLQFLAESVAITGLGSVVGVLLGLGGAFGVTAVMRARTEAVIYAAFTWGTVAIAVAAAVTVGIAFGIYPALRAARLSPIDAIRHET